MSNAEPMDHMRRLENYAAQAKTTPYGSGWWPTPRQNRRSVHKQRKGQWGYGYPGTKGYATYPRAAAITERLANRRGAEALADAVRAEKAAAAAALAELADAP